MVGSLGGDVVVTPTGAATYSIPIEVPPGTHGMQPSLAITYNSAAGRGLLGMGWDLTGRSAITRISRTGFYDNATGSVNFDGNDRLALDGARLVKLSSGSYFTENAVYGTEVENFTRVTLHGQPSSPNTVYFTAVNDQGQLFEYGKSNNSLIYFPQGGVYAWMVNKVTDPDGNYMSFYYERESTGEAKLVRIGYTGNSAANQSKFSKVMFHYTADPNSNKTYVGGNTVTTSNLLDGIAVMYGNDTIRQYRFDYDFDRSTRLRAVILQDANGSELTRTTIKWNDDYENATFRAIENLGQCGVHTGDFDANGIPDLFLYQVSVNNNTCNWWVRTGDSLGNFNTPSWSGSVSGYTSFFTMDLEGDGRDEIGYVFKNDTDDESYDLKAIQFGTINNHIVKILSTNETKGFLVGDFLGCGGIQPVRISEPSGDSCTVTLDTMNVSFKIHKNGMCSVTDLNGNGKTDIQVVCNSRVFVYEYDAPCNSFVKLVNNQWLPNNPTRNYHGDFNGDGMTDYIYFTYAEGAGHWYLKMSKGNDYKPTEELALNTTHGNYITPTFPLFISDINGDGKDDIIQPTRTGNGPLTLNVYYSRRYDNDDGWFYDTIQVRHNNIDLYSVDYLFADLNHDGKNELLYTGSIYQDPIVVSFPERREHDLVSSITNGFGMTTSLEYQYCNSPSLGYLGMDGKRIHYPIASRMVQPDGIGGSINTVFTYGFSVYDRARKQMLGFNNQLISRNGTTVMHSFEHNEAHHFLDHIQTVTYYTGRQEEIGGYVADSSYWSHDRYTNHYETYITPGYRNLDFGRFVPYNAITNTVNRLENSSEMVYCWLNTAGRLKNTATVRKQHYVGNGQDPWISRDSTSIVYLSVSLPNGETAVKPDYIVTRNKRYGFSQAPFRKTKYTYSSGRVETETVTESYDTVGVTSYTYNDLGMPVTETYKPKGLPAATRSFVYDSKGRFVKRETDVLGYTRSANYDYPTGLMQDETDVNGLTTCYQYDALGRVTAVTRPDQTVRHIGYFWYSGEDFPETVYYVRETEAGLPETRTYYDILGRPTHTYRAGSGYDDIVYDEKGRVAKKTVVPYPDPDASSLSKTWHTSDYDEYDRLTEEIQPYTHLAYSYDLVSNLYAVTVTDNIRNTQRTTVTDAMGRMVRSVDAGGTVNYSYSYITESGKTRDRMTVSVGNATTTVVSDIRGNRLSIQDPDAGTVATVYDALGRPVRRTDANGNTTVYSYDLAGRVLTAVYESGSDSETVAYTYDNAPGRGVGKLASVRHDSSLECEYVYDALGRLSNRKVHDGNEVFEHLYAYDTLGRLQYLTYPDGFRIMHTYNSYGELEFILNASDNSLIYAIDERNKFRKPLKCRFGNDTGTEYSYNAYGMLTGIKNGNLTVSGGTVNSGVTPGQGSLFYIVGGQYRKLTYAYNTRGFIGSKYDERTEQGESYTYDALDRLTSFTVNNVTAATFTYGNNGNITSNTKVGDYAYESGKPHAVTSIEGNLSCPIHLSQCDVEYNVRNMPSAIVENGYRILIDYDASGMRRHTEITAGNTLVKEKTRISSLFETEATPFSSRRLDYIYAEGRIVAVRVYANGSGSLYYVLTDHLGSWERVLDQSRNTIQQTHFDPWGNRMSFTAWNTPQTQTTFNFDRGFTGHEHYDSLHIINANARLYDPVIGRFFSPDPYVQTPDFTQAFNRYSYCMNNPVMYSDPTGELFGIDDLIAAAALGAIINGFTQIVAGNVNNVGDFFLAAGIGALSGAAGGYVGQATAGAMNVATSWSSSVINGTSVGTFGGFAGGFVSSAGNSWVNGAGFAQGLQAGLIGGGQGALCGAFIGGITGGFRYQKQIRVFQKGCMDLGINGGEPVPTTDCFLSEAQQAWYKDAPIDLLDAFSVENVPSNYQMDMDAMCAPGITVPTIDNNIIKGNSSVYFNKNLAFSSAKQLFFTMGHEFVHVSQFGALANQASKLLTSDFLDMLDYHAYNYQNALGGLHLNSFTREQIMSWSTTYSQFYNMNYICFPWTSNHLFKYPF